MSDSNATEITNMNRAETHLADQPGKFGAEGEPHQRADSEEQTSKLPTNQRVPLAKDQNSLKMGRQRR